MVNIGERCLLRIFACTPSVAVRERESERAREKVMEEERQRG